MTKDYPPYLDYPKERNKMTNADKIRQMTDEELAKNLADLFGECAFPHIPHSENARPPCVKYDFCCEKCWLDWLKQEVRDGSTGSSRRCVMAMRDYDELVRDLREYVDAIEREIWDVPYMIPDIMKEAADAIEELTTLCKQPPKEDFS